MAFIFPKDDDRDYNPEIDSIIENKIEKQIADGTKTTGIPPGPLDLPSKDWPEPSTGDDSAG